MSTIHICREEFERFKDEVEGIASWPAKFSWNKHRAWPSDNKSYTHRTLNKIFEHLRDTYYENRGTTPMFWVNDHQITKVAHDKAVMAVFDFETCADKPQEGLSC